MTAARGKIVYASVTDIGFTNTVSGSPSDRSGYIASISLGLTATDYPNLQAFRPAGAKAWEFSEGGKALTFTIRDDVVFHDGTKVTVDDWVYRYDNLWLHPTQPGAIPPTLPPVPERVAKVDSSKFRIVWPSPDAAFLGAYGITGEGMGVYSKAYIERVGFAEFAKKPIGAGPYKFGEWRPADRVIIEANAQFFEGPPQVKTAEIVFVPEDTTRLAMFLTGEADIALSLPPTMLSRAEAKPGAKIVTAPIFMSASMMFQAGVKTIPGTDRANPFNDVRVRKAVAYSIDRKAILERIVGRSGAPVKGPYPEYIVGYGGNNIVEYEYNPTKARQLLEEANYPFDQPFTLLTYPLSPPMPAAMEAAVTYMQAIGMKVQYSLREVSASTKLWDQKKRDPTATGVYPLQGVRSVNFTDVARGIYGYYNSKDGSFPQYDPKLDALLVDGALAFEPGAREDANKRLFRYLHEQALYLTLYDMRENHAVGPRVDFNFPPQAARPNHLGYVTWRPGYP